MKILSPKIPDFYENTRQNSGQVTSILIEVRYFGT